MNYSIFKISLIAKDEIRLPYFKGSAFRGLFGHSLKKTVCVTNMSSCENCLLRRQCVYAYMFETFNERNEHVAHPFVLEPPLIERRLFSPKDRLELNLILFGKAIEYLPFIIYTFKEMGKRGLGVTKGKFQLEKIMQKDRIIYDFKEQIVHTDFKPLNLYDNVIDDKKTTNLLIHFITPTALKKNGKISKEIDLVILLKAILRRLKALSIYHNGNDIPNFEISFNEIGKTIKQTKSYAPFRWKRYSNRQKREIDFSGIVGTLELEGDLRPYMQLLRIGEIIHVGRGTVYGMGKYVISI